MIKIEHNEQLILVDRNKNTKKVFKNIKELLDYVSEYYEKHWYFNKLPYNNIILDSLNVTGKDKGYYIDTNVFVHDLDREAWGEKPYIVYNSCGKIVDIRRYFNKGLKPVNRVTWNRKKYLKAKDSGYRREPVSRTGYKHKYYHWNRNIAYKSTLTALTIPEYKEYTSPKEIRRLSDIYGIDTLRHVEKNWKSQNKCRKQWMIHSKSKTKRHRKMDNNYEEFSMDDLLAEDFEIAA